MELEVERMQYGVGQGCFHTQRISIGNDSSRRGFHKDNQFDFVYDCGSVSSIIGDALAWAIQHYRPKRSIKVDTKNSNPRVVDALFISHFHADHINGIPALCAVNKVRLLFVPYHTPDEVMAVLIANAEWLSSAALPTVLWFLTAMENLANGRDLFDIPTVRVVPNEDTPNLPSPRAVFPDLPRIAHVDQKVKSSWTMTSGQPIEFVSEEMKIWEIRAWHFKPPITHAKDFERARKELEAAIGGPVGALPEVSEKVAQALKSAANSIHQRMSAAMKRSAVAHAANHNIVSMCVYSGPTNEGMLKGRIKRLNAPSPGTPIHYSLSGFMSPGGRGSEPWLHLQARPAEPTIMQLGWLGTGDAMLKLPAVWDDFEAKMQWSAVRSELTATVLMPHHGSFGGQNHCAGLIERHNPLALFSAGALKMSSDPHPAAAVISDALKHAGNAVNVTELTRPGVFELVTAEI